MIQNQLLEIKGLKQNKLKKDNITLQQFKHHKSDKMHEKNE